MAKRQEIKIDGVDDRTLTIAPLTVDQMETHHATVEGGDPKAVMQSAWEMVVASISNAGDKGVSVSSLKKMITYPEFDMLQREVLSISGFKRVPEGEPVATVQ